MIELQQYIEGCKKNDRKSQKALYDSFSRQMFSICLRYCQNSEDAADVLQEAFIKIFKSIHELKELDRVAGWIKTIVVRTALRFLKTKRDFIGLDEAPFLDQPYQMKVEFDKYNYNRMIEHLRSLPIGYQTVFNMYVFDELSHAEIAKELDCSENTSRSQLFKARKQMQELIEKDQALNSLKQERI